MKVLKWILRIVIALNLCVLAAFALMTIYTFSAEDASMSASRSGAVTEFVRDKVQPLVESTETGRKVSEKVKEIVVRVSPYGANWEQNIRKLAHFSEYFLLATLLYLILSVLKVPWWLKIILVIGACGMAACLDEMHQGEVAGRFMALSDVIIDTSGAVFSVLVWSVTGKLFKWLAS